MRIIFIITIIIESKRNLTGKVQYNLDVSSKKCIKKEWINPLYKKSFGSLRIRKTILIILLLELIGSFEMYSVLGFSE